MSSLLCHSMVRFLQVKLREAYIQHGYWLKHVRNDFSVLEIHTKMQKFTPQRQLYQRSCSASQWRQYSDGIRFRQRRENRGKFQGLVSYFIRYVRRRADAVVALIASESRLYSDKLNIHLQVTRLLRVTPQHLLIWSAVNANYLNASK